MTTFREFFDRLEKSGRLTVIKKPVSKNLDLAGLMHELDGKVVYAPKVEGSDFGAVGNIYSTRELVCDGLDITQDKLIPTLIHAINKPSKPQLMKNPARRSRSWRTALRISTSRSCQSLSMRRRTGDRISPRPSWWRMTRSWKEPLFHRMMVIGKDRVVLRILHRHLEEFIKRAGGELDVAVIVGSPINVLLAGAMSVKTGQDELEIGNSLQPVRTVKLGNGIEYPGRLRIRFRGQDNQGAA